MEIKHAINGKILGLFLFCLLFHNSLFSQSKPPIYLMFNENSEEICDIHQTRKGSFHKVKDVVKYAKIEQKNKDIHFYICKEKFVYEKSKMEKRMVCKNFLHDKKRMNYEELVDYLNKMQDKCNHPKFAVFSFII